jgi:asparagine synthase (glutamine-hydrolysing)
MCGIAGFLTLRPSPAAREGLQRICDVLQHRGPDDFGYYVSEPAFLGHRRLSIVDLAGGHQPLYNEDHTRLIVYNGEVFNHAGLRAELERAGHRYRTRSDSETILHGWEQWGADSVARLRGMFAFAIWDQPRQRLFAARDRLGKKPFYYYWDSQTFAFASEIKALLEHPEISATPNEAVFGEYLAFGYVSGEETMFGGIRKLMPGHWLEWFLDGQGQPQLRIERYWDVPMQGGEVRPEGEWIDRTRQTLEEAVQLRLMADVPLGTFLSGGVDSSAITALVQRMTIGRVKSFAVGYPEQDYSELDYARQVAAVIGTEHHEVVLGREDFFNALPALIWHEDEPICWPSSVSLYFLSRLAADQVKVVLTGEGSDELFGGYERYRWTPLNLRAAGVYRFVPETLRRAVRSFITSSPLLRADLRRKTGHSFLGREPNLESLYLDNFYAAFSLQDQRQLWNTVPCGPVYEPYLRHWEAHPKASLLQRMLYADQKTYLVELLMKQDQMSMAASIESRVPFLDHELVALAMQIPDYLKIKGREQKYILKKSVEDLLPPSIVYRRKKGFPTPLRQWMRDEDGGAVMEPLRSRTGFLSHYVQMEAVQRLLESHQSGREDATDRIWRLLNLAHWGEMQFGRLGRNRNAALAMEQLNHASVAALRR